jgi:hypothetical protein
MTLPKWQSCRVRIFKRFMEPRNRFQGMNFASLCSLAGRYDNPIPPWFLVPIDSLKIPALCSLMVSRMALFQQSSYKIKFTLRPRIRCFFLSEYSRERMVLYFKKRSNIVNKLDWSIHNIAQCSHSSIERKSLKRIC